MSKYELKTKLNDASVIDFLNKVEHEQKKKDAFVLLDLFTEITKEEAKMWGGSIIGFGQYHYKYASGQEGDWMRVGFSPRKANLTLYVLCYNQNNFQELLDKLGKYKAGKGCLYINKLADVDVEVLKELIKAAFNSKGMGEV